MKKIFVLVSLTFIILGSVSAFAAPDDGFGQAKKIESSHFSIYYRPSSDPLDLTQQLNITPSDRLLVGTSVTAGGSASVELAQATDILFSLVCNILDMQLYSYRGSIKVCLNEDELHSIYQNLFGKAPESGHLGSFYVYELNTIYITQESFKRSILGHEIGHAVISNYFVVQPSVKIQEVLAGYVEYQLRKTAP